MTPSIAPVLIAPRIFDADLCRRLIAGFEPREDAASGVIRDVANPELRREALGAIERNLLPMIHRTFQFRATRMERPALACQGPGETVEPRRDNQTPATAHRRFTCAISLDAQAFEGGDLYFPEFGDRTYRLPTGGAAVFACGLLHATTAVTRGRRHEFAAFLHDVAGDGIGRRDAARLEPSAAAGS